MKKQSNRGATKISTTTPLELNLDYGLLTNFKLGEKHNECLAEPFVQSFEYGYSIGLENFTVSSIMVILRAGYEGFNAFCGPVISNGNSYYFSSSSTVSDLVDVLGKPFDTWNDGVEKCSMFNLNGICLEAIWHIDSFESLDYLCIEIGDRGETME